jgi:hypothetical protein
MGVRGSYIDGAEASAEAFLDAINRAVTHRGSSSVSRPSPRFQGCIKGIHSVALRYDDLGAAPRSLCGTFCN